MRTPGAQPATIHSTRSFAILHAAIFDSVNSILGRFTPYLVRLPDVSPQTSQVAAADQAAHDVLLALYPAFQTRLDGELQQDLAQIPDGKPKTDGIAVGQIVAAEILAFRANDGSGVTPPPFNSKNVPGFYRPTPPDFTPADFTQWGVVTPFAIVSAREFLPEPISLHLSGPSFNKSARPRRRLPERSSRRLPFEIESVAIGLRYWFC